GHGGGDDGVEQVLLPRQGRTAAPAGDLAPGAPEVEVDVVGPGLLDEHPHGLAHGDRVDAVELDGARGLIGLVVDDAHGLRAAFDQGTGGDHLGHIEPGSVFAAQATERGVRDPGHGGEHDRGGQLDRPDPQGCCGGRGHGFWAGTDDTHETIIPVQSKSHIRTSGLLPNSRCLRPSTPPRLDRGIDSERPVHPFTSTVSERRNSRTSHSRSTANSSASRSSWVTTISAPPNPSRAVTSASSEDRSRLLPGSSRTSSCGAGSCRSPAARATRKRSPPDSVEQICSVRPAGSPIAARTSWTRCGSRCGLPARTASITVRSDGSRYCWSRWATGTETVIVRSPKSSETGGPVSADADPSAA